MSNATLSHLILFITSLVIVAGVAGTLSTAVTQISGSIQDGSISVSENIRTDISIINDPKANYNPGNNLELYVRNEGSNPIYLDKSQFQLTHNGKFVRDFNIKNTNSDNDNLWKPDEVINIIINEPKINNGNNIVYITVNKDEEKLQFYS